MKRLKSQLEKADKALELAEAQSARKGVTGVTLELKKARQALDAARAEVAELTDTAGEEPILDPYRSVRRGSPTWRQGLVKRTRRRSHDDH